MATYIGPAGGDVGCTSSGIDASTEYETSVEAFGDAGPYSGSLVAAGDEDGRPIAQVTLSLQGDYFFSGSGEAVFDFGNFYSGCCSLDETCTLKVNFVRYNCHNGGIFSYPVDLVLGNSYPISLYISIGTPQDTEFYYDLTEGLPAGTEITAVPEPASVLLLLTGIPIALLRRARKSNGRAG
jgi:hypothetical protein